MESPLTVLTHITLSLDALNCAALVVGRNGTIAHVNPRFCESVQRSRESLVGSDLVSLYPPGDACAVVKQMINRFDEFREAEFFLPLPDDQRLPVVISARPIGNSSVLSDYSVITLIDISKQKKAEQKLIDQNTRLGELSEVVLQQTTKLRDYAGSLEQRVEQRTAELHDAHMETIFILAIASEAKDEDTGAHVRRVRRMTQLLAGELGVEPTEAERIGYAAVLHDVGKIHTPDHILKKPGPLFADERNLMQEHTLAGERILRPSPFFALASQIARSHHENWDGTGYPDQLSESNIPFEARLVHLVDVFDALVNERIYKPAWTREQALAEIVRNRGKMFDPQIADAFARLEENGEVEKAQKAGNAVPPRPAVARAMATNIAR